MVTNIRSLPSKIDELQLTISIKRPDIIFVTETWLDYSFNDGLVNLSDYFISRTDRCNRKGGGTAIYIRHGIEFETLPPIQCSVIDVENTVINMKHPNIFLVCVYFPPDLLIRDLKVFHEEIVQKFDQLLTENPDHNVIIAGDFNHFNVDNLCTDLSLLDLVKQPTRGRNILDHVLVSDSLSEFYNENLVDYDAPIGNSDHKTVTATPKEKMSISNELHAITVYDFRKSHLNALIKQAEKMKWKEILNRNMSVDEMCNTFHYQLHCLLISSIPRKTVRLSQRDKEWMTPLTKSLINARWNAYRNKDWEKYEHLKRKVKDEILKAKRITAEKLLETSTGLWKLTRSISGKMKRDEWSSLVNRHGSTQALSDAVANIFEVSAASSKCDPTSENNNSTQDDDWTVTFSYDDVVRELKTLSPRKSPGSDGIPSLVYSTLANYIAIPLTQLFQASIQQRSFPDSWKYGITVPVPKTSPPDILKLRPITLLPVPSKILERLVMKAMWNYFENSYGPSQHGFRSRASTTTALLHITDQMQQYSDDKKFFGSAVLAFDFSKAFDKMEHHILVDKLEKSSFPRGFILWLTQYLKDRTFSVKIQNTFSRGITVSRGVPQGSIIGPPLFCTFMSDLQPKNDTTTIVKYADDVTLIVPLPTRCPSEIHKSLEDEIDNIQHWCKRNNMELNLNKSKAFLNCRKEVILQKTVSTEIVHEMTILGLKLDKDLNWTSHTSFIIKKCSQRLHALRKLKSFLTNKQLHSVYLAHIRSLLDYCAPVLCGIRKGLNKKFQQIDNRAHRIIYGHASSRTCNCIELSQRRLTLSIKLFNKILHEDHILHTKLTRSLRTKPNLLQNIPCRTQKRHNSFFPSITRFYNSQNS